MLKGVWDKIDILMDNNLYCGILRAIIMTLVITPFQNGNGQGMMNKALLLILNFKDVRGFNFTFKNKKT